MLLTIYLFILLLGLLVGSFLNAIADRLNKSESFLKGRSKCDSCKHDLFALDLIPLFAFAFLKGKCRYCKSKLSYFYPLAELITGVLFVYTAYYTRIVTDFSYMNLLGVFYIVVLVCAFIVIFLSDAKYRIIPDSIIWSTIIFAVLFMIGIYTYSNASMYFQMKQSPIGKYLFEAGYFKVQVLYTLKSLGLLFASSLALFGFFGFLIFVTKGKGMGGGDMKLALLIGLFNGFPYNVMAIFLAFFIGAVYGIALIGLKKTTMKGTVPFGPFMVASSLFVFFGRTLIKRFTGI